MLLGIICGIGTRYQYGYFNLGEIIYILIGLLLIIKDKKVYYDKYLKIFVITMTAFIIYMGIYHALPIISQKNIIKNIFKYAEILIIVIITYQLIYHNKRRFINFLLCYFITCFFVGAIEYHSFFDVTYIHRATYLLILFSLLQYDKIFKRKEILLVIAIVLALYGRSRSALVIILAIVSYYFYQKLIINSKTKKQILIKFCILLSSMVIVCIGIQYLSNTLQKETASNIERKKLINVAVNAIKESPVYGIGPGNFSQYANEMEKLNIETNKTVHNFFLEILVEYGIIGFVLIMIPYLFIIIKLLKRQSGNSRMHWYAIYLMVFYLFNVMSGEVRVEYGMLLAISLFSIKNSKEEMENENSNDCIKL